MIIVAVLCLVIAHPGPVFAGVDSDKGRMDASGEPKANFDTEPAFRQDTV
jgi:hypothetical protein